MASSPRAGRLNAHDLIVGAIFIGFGAFFAVSALGMDLGTAFQMGPGFFPLALAAILVALGVAIALQSIRSEAAPGAAIPWRGLVLILAPPVLFGLTIRGLGLVPSIVLVVLLSAFASRRMTARFAVALAIGLAVFCYLVFSVGLGLPLPMFGPWLRGG